MFTSNYLPISAKMAYPRARMPLIVAAMGSATNALIPVHRKNNHMHQPEIVLGKDISHSPFS